MTAPTTCYHCSQPIDGQSVNDVEDALACGRRALMQTAECEGCGVDLEDPNDNVCAACFKRLEEERPWYATPDQHE